jgi:hypothetical protein
MLMPSVAPNGPVPTHARTHSKGVVSLIGPDGQCSTAQRSTAQLSTAQPSTRRTAIECFGREEVLLLSTRRTARTGGGAPGQRERRQLLRAGQSAAANGRAALWRFLRIGSGVLGLSRHCLRHMRGEVAIKRKEKTVERAYESSCGQAIENRTAVSAKEPDKERGKAKQ